MPRVGCQVVVCFVTAGLGRKRKAVLSFFRSASSRDRSPVKAASEVGGVRYSCRVIDGDSLEVDDDDKGNLPMFR